MGARSPTYLISGDRAALLVGADARSAARGQLWPRCALYVRNRAAFGIARSAAHLRANRLVSGLQRHESALGPVAAGGPATRRFDHVDSGRTGLCHRGIGADGGVAEGIGAAGKWRI